MSAYGTFLPSQPRRAMSVIGGRPADICSIASSSHFEPKADIVLNSGNVRLIRNTHRERATPVLALTRKMEGTTIFVRGLLFHTA